MDAGTLLVNSLSADNATRQEATAQLQNAMQNDYGGYMHTLAMELANEQQQSHIRNAAGIAIKNALTGREATTQNALLERWKTLDASRRTELKRLCLQTLGSPDKRAAGVSASAIAAIAACELPYGEWNELIGTLLEFVGQDNVGLRVATLQTIGYICEAISPEYLASRSNEILTAVVQGVRKEETNMDVQAAAIQALYNSLEFIRDNFEREGERNYIMQVVCEATQSSSIPVQVGAFECLVKIMQLYYDKMKLYMERALFGLTVIGMQNAEEKVALQAVEFWSTVCDEEAELMYEAQEAAEVGSSPVVESQNFAKVALPEILPQLLVLMQKQDEDAEDDEWNVAMAAGTCVGLLATVVGNDIVAPTIPFIEQNIQAGDWHQRDAAVMVFGSILDGPDEYVLSPLVRQALPTLIQMMNDGHASVRDSVAWTLGRITDLMIKVIQPEEHLPELVKALVFGLQQTGRIASSSCWSIKNLALGFSDEESDEATTTPLSPYYRGLMEALMSTSESRNNDGNARTATYEAIATLASTAVQDTLEFVSQAGLEILSRSEKLLELRNQLVGSDDRNNWNELQSNCCNVIQAIIRKVGHQIEPLADRIMNVQLQLLQTSAKDAAVAEDAFMTISSLVLVLDESFEKYTSHLMEFIFSALRTLDEFQVFTAAVGVTGDLARAVKGKISPYADPLLQALLAALSSPVLHRTAKPTVVSVFGDVAIALGSGFTPYLQNVMTMLSQAGQVQATSSSDAGMFDFVWAMRESIAEAFIGILTGLQDTDPMAFMPYVGGIIQFITSTADEEDASFDYLRTCYNLLGDMASTYKEGIKPVLLEPSISHFLHIAKMRNCKQRRVTDAVKYARQAVRAAVN
ncbi:hypothetical protein FFLO_04045 [Filobasidium floriforme]|uniref:Importin-95 n=1 Tax=Filobasidium floriforme TaxID=5210 RepID=A0A8K0NSL9_9TREE|nr:hypothetical protein FFLO_04045 [Filobasidium floriforme]